MTTQTFLRRADTGAFVALDKASDVDLLHAVVALSNPPTALAAPDVADFRAHGKLVRYGSTFGRIYEWWQWRARLIRVPADLTTDERGALPADVLEALVESFGPEYVAELALYLARRAAVEGPITTRPVAEK